MSKIRRGNADVDRRMEIDPSDRSEDSNVMRVLPSRDEADYRGKELALASGGRITAVAGKPIGKEDGIIAAQKGEWVIKKSAVKKLEQDHGPDAMDAINQGRLPS
jgi:hypothetical protein